MTGSGGAVQHDFNERRPYNAVSDFVDADAGVHGRKVAFIDPDRSLSYGFTLAGRRHDEHG